MQIRRFKSEDPGFNPLVGQVMKGSFVFLFLRVSSCADLFVPDPPSCVRHAPKCGLTLKIPYSSVVNKRVGLTAGGMVTQILHTQTRLVINQSWVAACFPSGKRPEISHEENSNWDNKIFVFKY